MLGKRVTFNISTRQNTHTLIPLKRGTSCLIIKQKIGPSCLGPSFESWAELAWADFYVGPLAVSRPFMA